LASEGEIGTKTKGAKGGDLKKRKKKKMGLKSKLAPTKKTQLMKKRALRKGGNCHPTGETAEPPKKRKKTTTKGYFLPEGGYHSGEKTIPVGKKKKLKTKILGMASQGPTGNKNH